jgi:CBS domain containing-hemolysin-like protein
MTWAIVIVLLVGGLYYSGFFSGSETGIYCLSRLRLHLGELEGDPQAVRLARILDDEPGALSVTLIGTNVMNYLTTSAVAFMFVELLGVPELDTELYTIVLMTPVVFVFGEVVPKNLFQRRADALMMRGSTQLAFFGALFRATGAIWCVTRLAAFVSNLALGKRAERHTTADPKRRMALLMQDALIGDVVGNAQSDLIDRVIRLAETPIHAIMVPWNRVATLPGTAGRRALLRLARRNRHARIPVHGKQRRQVMGLADVDVLLQTPDWQTIDERLEPAMTLSPNETVAVAMRRMQSQRRHMAIVVDRGGLLLGLVTLRDLLQEIVGELTVATEPAATPT